MKILGWGLSLFLFLCWPVQADEVRWKQLIQEGGEAQQRGDPGAAEMAFQSALKMAESGDDGLSDKHLELSLLSLAKHYKDVGQFAKAEPLLWRLLTINEKTLGADHPEVALFLKILGKLFKEQGRYGEAATLHRRALEIEEKSLGPEHPVVATSLHNLGFLLQEEGRYSEAESLYRRAMEIREKSFGPDHPDVVPSLSGLALVLLAQGRYDEAEPLLQRAISIREKTLGPEHPGVASILNNLGGLHQVQGRYGEAESLYRRALSIQEKSLGPEHLDVAISLSNLASVLQEQGRYSEAEPLKRRDLAIKEKALDPEHPDVALSLNNLALFLKVQGRHEAAEPIYRRVLVIQEKSLGPEHPDVASTLNNMASLYQAQKRYVEAAPLYHRALTIREKALGPEHPVFAMSLNNLATLLEQQGRWEEAATLHRRALEIEEKSLGPEHPVVATSLHNLGFLLQEEGRYSEAESLYRRALTIREKSLGPEHPDVAITLSNLAWLMKKAGDTQSALEFARRTSALLGKHIPTQVHRISEDAPERKQWANEYAQHATIGTTVYRSAPPNERPELLNEIFLSAQSATATSTANALAQMASRATAGEDALAQKVRDRQDAIARWRQYDRELLDVISKPKERRSAEGEALLRAQIARTEGEIRQLGEELQRDFPAYRELTAPVPLSVIDAQKMLTPEEGLLSWLVLKDETLLFLVTTDRAEVVRIDRGHDQLSLLIKRLRLSTEIPPVGGLPPFPHGQAYELYKLIIGPVEKHLDGVKHLILVPNGPLQSLSFGMLLTSAPQKDTQARERPWLARRYALTTLPGVSALRALRRLTMSETGREPFIGFGDPALKGSEGDTRGVQVSRLFPRGVVADTDAVAELQPLPETAEELRGIAAALKAPASSIYLGRHATETKVKGSPLAQYRTVAFATHGLMAGEFKGMAEPALVFTPPSTGSVEDDGLLTASEVAGLNLNADWVILSACNTAAPDGTPGAGGFSGLTKAFFYAGARSLLVSHWAVESKSAAKITTRLFSETAKGLPKTEALKMAIMSLADQPETSHPAYWAPFVIVGDGR